MQEYRISRFMADLRSPGSCRSATSRERKLRSSRAGGWRCATRFLAGGQETTVRPRGFFGRRFEIDSPAGPMETRGNFSGRQYAITRGGMPAAGVTQLRTLREQFAVEVADGEDAVLMLAVVLVIEIIRDDRRRSAGG